MIQHKTVSRIVLLTGILLIITAGIHILNMSDAVIAIKTGDIAPSHASSVFSVWLFSGISMLLIGIWLIYLSMDLRRQSRRARAQILFIGAGLSCFSIISWSHFPKEIHLFYFLLLGLCLLITMLLNAGKSNGESVS